MVIALTSLNRLPAVNYGGTERVIWDLSHELQKLGNKVYIIGPEVDSFEHASAINCKLDDDLVRNLPDDIDIVHFHSPPGKNFPLPHVFTMHGNAEFGSKLPIQTIFISKNQAKRHGGDHFVYNGLSWSDNNLFEKGLKRYDFHFLGKAAWRRKNVVGAIKCIKKARAGKLNVLGGHRFNFSMGFRFTIDPNIRFHGMVDDTYKYRLMKNSKALLMPIRWHEPFGLALIESLYCGCPVLGTPYGSLPELIPPNVGFLSHKSEELIDAMREVDQWSAKECHNYACQKFNSRIMAMKYLEIYQRVLNGEVLNAEEPRLQKPSPKLLPFE